MLTQGGCKFEIENLKLKIELLPTYNRPFSPNSLRFMFARHGHLFSSKNKNCQSIYGGG